MPSRIRSGVQWTVDTYVLFVVLGLIVGLAIAPAAFVTTGGSDGTVAVVPVDGTIDGQQSAQYARMMAEARSEADAVVIVANSGGGSAAASEEMYMQTVRTAEEMPVVAAVDAAAASGAYYTIAPAETVYVKPSSIVGSVGVLAPVPQRLEPNDIIGTTGPNKLTGGDRRSFFYDLETLQNAFVGAVYEQRGDRITLERRTVESARTYVGAEAVDVGLADGVGDRQAAIREAADRAGLDRPEIRLMTPGGPRAFMVRSTYLASTAEEKRMQSPSYLFDDSTGLPTFLMVPAAVVADEEYEVISASELPEDWTEAGDGTETGTDNETADSTGHPIGVDPASENPHTATEGGGR